MKTKPCVFLGACLLATSAVIAAGSSVNPAVGTWELNVAKSTFAGAAPKGETRTYSESADGATTLTEKTVAADGTENTVSMTYKPDGKDYPITGSPTFDTLSVKPVSSRTIAFSLKKAGKVVATGRRTVSKDGKTLTMTETATNESGAKVEEREVYDKQ
jgi:hypothetical protein